MSKINIRGLQPIEDPNYRYKMSSLNIVRERALMSIDNLPIICKDIERHPEMLVEFIKHKLGTNLSYKKDKLKYSDKISNESIEISLYEFIEMFVLCNFCNLPETNMFVKKDKGQIEFICRACSSNLVLQVDKLKVEKHIKKTCQTILSKIMKDCVKTFE